MKLPSLILIIPILLLSYYSNGQNLHRSPVEFGLSAGINLTKVPLLSYGHDLGDFWSQYTSNDYKTGFQCNSFVKIPITRRFSLQPELGFAFFNQKQIYSNDVHLNGLGSVSLTDKLYESLFTLDALLKYRTKYFFLNAGPQIGIISASRINTTDRTNAYDNTYYNNNETDFKKDGKTTSPVFSLLFGLSKEDFFKNWGAGFYYRLGLSGFTEFYHSQQIGKVSGFLFQVSYTFKR